MTEAEPDGTVTGRRAILINLALGLSSFLTLFDVTAVVVAMPAVAKDLGFDVAGLAWVIGAYSLAFTGALAASGALADRFGAGAACWWVTPCFWSPRSGVEGPGPGPCSWLRAVCRVSVPLA